MRGVGQDGPDFWQKVLTDFIHLHGIALLEAQSLRRPNQADPIKPSTT
jgi:hypothetical protein